jgi:WD40 repeat protein
VYIAVAVGRNIRLWNRVEDREVAVLAGHNGNIAALAFSPDSTLLASASDDYYEPIYVSYTRNGDMHLALLIPPENRYDFDRRVSSLTFSRDGQHLLSGHHDRTVRVWYLEEFERVRTLTGWHDWVVAVAIRPWCDVAQGCDDVLVGGDWQGWLVSVRWSMGGAYAVNRLQWNGWEALVASPSSNLLAAIGHDDQLWILDVETLEPIVVLGGPAEGA